MPRRQPLGTRSWCGRPSPRSPSSTQGSDWRVRHVRRAACEPLAIAAAAAGDAELVRQAVIVLTVPAKDSHWHVRKVACEPLATAAAAAGNVELVRQAVTALIGLAKDSESGVRDARGRV